MRRNLFILIILTVASFLLTACTTNYDRKDIINYVKNEVLISDFTVSKSYEKIKDEEGYIDRLWTVKDKKSNVTFHVLDDFSWGSESVSNILRDDYDASVFILLYDELDKKDNISFIKDESSSLIKADLLCSYKNKDELKDCYDSLVSYKNQVIEYGYDLKVPYAVEYDFKIKKFDDYLDNVNTQYGYLNDVNEKIYNEMIYDYYSVALTHQIDDALLEMNSLDKNLIMNHEDTHRIFKILDNGIVKYYDDVIANENYYGISFGGLYKILSYEKFNVYGNSWHYTVTVNSDIYEFSYDFNDLLYEVNDEEQYGYYYKKNGQKIKMKYYFYNCFTATEINEMFGLNIGESANRFMGQ